MTLIPEVLENVIHMLEGSLSSDNNIQKEVFRLFSDMKENIPFFIFYLLHIVEDSEISIILRKQALILISRSIFSTPKELLPSFFSEIFQVLESIFSSTNDFIPIAAYTFGFIYNNFNTSIPINLHQIIVNLISNEDTVIPTLYIIKNIPNCQLYPEILEILPSFVTPNYAELVFSILVHHTFDATSYIHAKISPLILDNFLTFPEQAQALACLLEFEMFTLLHDHSDGNLIAFSIAEGSEAIFSTLTDELYSRNDIPPFPPIILSLLSHLITPDDDPLTMGPCSTCQEILRSMVCVYGDQVQNPDTPEEINVIQFICSQLPLCCNPGHFLRVLYTVIGCSPNVEQYIPIIKENLSTEFRVDAINCLLELSNSSPNFIIIAASVAFQMLTDPNDIVRHNSIFVIDGLLKNINNNSTEENLKTFKDLFETADEKVLLLVQLTASNNSEDVIYLSDITCSFFKAMGKYITPQTTISIFQKIKEFFITQSPCEIHFIPFSNILGQMIISYQIPIENFPDIQELFAKIQLLLVDFSTMAFYDEMLISLFKLIRGIFETYEELALGPNTLNVIGTLFEYLDKNSDCNSIVIEKLWKCNNIILHHLSSLIPTISDFLISNALIISSSLNISLSSCIAKSLIDLVPLINSEDLVGFMNKFFVIISITPMNSKQYYYIARFYISVVQELQKRTVSLDEKFININIHIPE